MSQKVTISFALLGIIAAGAITVLCILLLPSPLVAPDPYTYDVNDRGTIKWYNATGHEQLSIYSEVLAHLHGSFNKTDVTETVGCGRFSASITTVQRRQENVQCWKVRTKRGGILPCFNQTLRVKDCVSMTTDKGKSIFWFGGAEMISQKWPVNSMNLNRKTSFLSSDLPKRCGNVLERYFLSSHGAAVYVDPDVPLYISVHQDKDICLEAMYDGDQLVGPSYLHPVNDEIDLNYVICLAGNAKKVHQVMTDSEDGFIKRPKSLPDLKMMKHPIWSTWARFKSDIDQSVVENFAEEILLNNFTNSQLEIDDGYEKAYGDFSFSETKFPNATAMIKNLHKKGFRVTTWVTPFINLNSANYNYARKQQFFLTDDSGSPDIVRWWNGRGSVVDFTNHNAASWYKQILSDVKEQFALDSFKFDAGETSYLPSAGLNYSAVPKTNPSYYTTYYAETAFEIGGVMSEMRSSWKTQDINMYMRLMDKGSSWGTLRGFQTVIPTALTFSILGYIYVLPDMIGGNAYVLGSNNSGKPDRELYIRWIELGAFLPCMQFSISPWQYDDEVVDIAQKYVTIHRTVVYDELVKAAERYVSGEMSLLVSPVWFYSNAADDEIAFTINDQFIVGDRYLVAPIVEKGSTARNVYLPGDDRVRWIDRMREDCSDDVPGCVVQGGKWVMSYYVPLNKISWWEKSTKL
ncbi:unnamed protein product [Clavelina lepadiformis]|uniref:Uncharacterized protein n=1 Tax=Clavelina lepadiformis TaxID=159417 RepID=A0ABP0GH04_CLALP